MVLISTLRSKLTASPLRSSCSSRICGQQSQKSYLQYHPILCVYFRILGQLIPTQSSFQYPLCRYMPHKITTLYCTSASSFPGRSVSYSVYAHASSDTRISYLTSRNLRPAGLTSRCRMSTSWQRADRSDRWMNAGRRESYSMSARVSTRVERGPCAGIHAREQVFKELVLHLADLQEVEPSQNRYRECPY